MLCYAQLAESLGQDGDGHRVGGGRGFSGLVLVGTTNVVGRCESRTVLTGTGAAGIQRGGRERYSKVGCESITIQVFTITIQVSNLFKNL